MSALTLLACTPSNEHCGRADIEQLFKVYLTEQLTKLLSNTAQNKDSNNLALIDAKVKNVLALMDLDVEDIKTLSQDSAKQASQCTGKIKISVPPPMLDDIEDFRKYAKLNLIAQYAKELGIENKENTYTQSIDYVVKVVNKSLDVSVLFDSYAWEHLLNQMLTPLLDQPILSHVKPVKNYQEIQPDEKVISQEETLTEPVIKPIKPIMTPKIEGSLIDNNKSITKLTGPSFDCNNATKPTDKTICTSRDLAGLDLENMTLYKKAKLTNPTKTHEIWRESIKYKYACGTEVECINHIYKKTIKLYNCVINNANCQNQIDF
ncbi:MAG: hypothetical protein NTY69_01510 [Methylococcales bacterium]|nr:hypothetical protein [Methylococcales bacterium]